MTCQCDVSMPSGFSVALTVQLHWTVAVVKDRLEEAAGVPCYEQLLVCGTRTLLNNDVLLDVNQERSSLGERISMLLVRIDLPQELAEADVQRAWELFRIYSTDGGETICRSHFESVMGFMELPRHGGDVEPTFPGSKTQLSFVDVLHLVVKETQGVPTESCGLPEPEMPSNDQWRGYRDSCNSSACTTCRRGVLRQVEHLPFDVDWKKLNMRLLKVQKKQILAGSRSATSRISL
eukprot:TRINITY_DN38504_c0_g1_i1.p1 TRINITY_DN38504_c0_g1~~TRINITY_DN38504_c0_g1_i1.p1  ORF type:complete len:245 (-),score=38.65 TRINITY_DN38504_c0_g1_i1:190-894(-)